MNELPAKLSSDAVDKRYEDAETVYSVLGSITRRERWEPPETMRTVSVLGSIVLDYLDVELTGSVFLGSVETKGGKGRLKWLRRARERLLGQEAKPEDDYERPLLSVDCSGVMGSVEVKLR